MLATYATTPEVNHELFVFARENGESEDRPIHVQGKRLSPADWWRDPPPVGGHLSETVTTPAGVPCIRGSQPDALTAYRRDDGWLPGTGETPQNDAAEALMRPPRGALEPALFC